jgi:hypothetical protein
MKKLIVKAVAVTKICAFPGGDHIQGMMDVFIECVKLNV